MHAGLLAEQAPDNRLACRPVLTRHGMRQCLWPEAETSACGRRPANPRLADSRPTGRESGRCEVQGE